MQLKLHKKTLQQKHVQKKTSKYFVNIQINDYPIKHAYIITHTK